MVWSALWGYFKKSIIVFVLFSLFVLQMPIITIFAIDGNWIDDAQAYQPPMVGDVFLVSTANQLAWVSYMVQNGSTFSGRIVELQNDIDLVGKEWTPIGGWNGTQTDTSKYFSGTFDGKGFGIKNVAINLPDREYVGLFGRSGGKIENVGVIDVDVKGHNSTGGLVGYGSISNLINCYATGFVTGYDHVGGLIGYGSISKLTNCYATGSVTGNYKVGGLIGYDSSSKLTNCYATGFITGYDYVGGLVGYGSSSAITNCYATGNVTGTYSGGSSGGGSSSGGSSSGGYDPIILNCYATGSVTGNYKVGGLLGYMSYYTIIAYWNTDTQQKMVGGSTPSTDSELTGLTTAEMKSPAFVDMLNDHINIEWAAWKYDVNNENDSYPILDYEKGVPNLWIANVQQPIINGDTYEIRTPQQLAWVAKETNNGNTFEGKTVKLINDIDLQGKGWTPIGTTIYYEQYGSSSSDSIYFSGIFDGNFKKIKNLTIGNKDYPSSFVIQYNSNGMFGKSGNAKFKNVGVEDIRIFAQGTESCVGGLLGATANIYGIGQQSTDIDNCYTTGVITANSGGGITGSITANLSNSFSNVILNCKYSAGGLIGDAGGFINDSYIINCYATGDVEGFTIGGFSGSDSSHIITSSYWNKSATHKSDGFILPDNGKKGVGDLAIDPTGLFGKTITELKQQSTYVGWDFANTWAIDPIKNGGLPYLQGFDMTDVAANSITLFPTATALNVGEEMQLQVTISPANASNSIVSYNSSDPNIASVNESGKVTAISLGRAIITVTTQDGSKTAACEVIVNPRAVVFDYKINSIEILNSQYNNITIPVSGGFYASANITKNTAISGAKSVLMSVYDRSSKLMLIKPTTISLNQGQSTSIDIWIDNIDNAKIGTIKVFVWDDIGNMLPLSDAGLYENI